jgi:hypothetical protein
MLNRSVLAEWIPDFQTNTTLDLSGRGIKSIQDGKNEYKLRTIL